LDILVSRGTELDDIFSCDFPSIRDPNTEIFVLCRAVVAHGEVLHVEDGLCDVLHREHYSVFILCTIPFDVKTEEIQLSFLVLGFAHCLKGLTWLKSIGLTLWDLV
jgi:hypothetical protein